MYKCVSYKTNQITDPNLHRDVTKQLQVIVQCSKMIGKCWLTIETYIVALCMHTVVTHIFQPMQRRGNKTFNPMQKHAVQAYSATMLQLFHEFM